MVQVYVYAAHLATPFVPPEGTHGVPPERCQEKCEPPVGYELLSSRGRVPPPVLSRVTPWIPSGGMPRKRSTSSWVYACCPLEEENHLLFPSEGIHGVTPGGCHENGQPPIEYVVPFFPGRDRLLPHPEGIHGFILEGWSGKGQPSLGYNVPSSGGRVSPPVPSRGTKQTSISRRGGRTRLRR